jgi:hypothetical protein
MRCYLQKNHHANYGEHLKFETKEGKITDPKFQWEEEGAEFRYDHALYDIVTIDVQNGCTLITCLKDNSENQLEKQLDEIRKTEHKSSSTNTRSQIKFFSVFCHIGEKLVTDIFWHSVAIKPMLKYSILLRASEIVSPPPQC